MPKLYVLVKRSSAKSWQAAIPAKAGVTKAKLRSVVAKSRKKGFSYRIVSDAELKRIVKRKTPKRTKRKRARKRTKRIRRRKR
jgi:hypothetical protein